MDLLERFLTYVRIPTSSNDRSETVPSAGKEFILAHKLAADMKELGIADAHVDAQCYVYGHIPATPGYGNRTKIGFISHLDTSPDFADEPVNVMIHEDYDGEDVVLGDSGRTITTANFPHLKDLKGRTLLTTDGRTLLGADDKAGVAEILHAVQKLLADKVPHGPISLAFTPDEEVGTSADHFDLAEFDAQLAYTVDGSAEGEVVYENFNACSASFAVRGYNIHPGEAKGRMINASLVAIEINSMLPAADIPRLTEGYEGFFHLTVFLALDNHLHFSSIVWMVFLPCTIICLFFIVFFNKKGN